MFWLTKFYIYKNYKNLYLIPVNDDDKQLKVQERYLLPQTETKPQQIDVYNKSRFVFFGSFFLSPRFQLRSSTVQEKLIIFWQDPLWLRAPPASELKVLFYTRVCVPCFLMLAKDTHRPEQLGTLLLFFT